MSASRKDLENESSKAAYKNRKEDCRDKYYGNKYASSWMTSPPQFSPFFKCKGEKECEEQVYKEYEKCMAGPKS